MTERLQREGRERERDGLGTNREKILFQVNEFVVDLFDQDPGSVAFTSGGNGLSLQLEKLQKMLSQTLVKRKEQL